jgi:drug/metabolite transporter, DME family
MRTRPQASGPFLVLAAATLWGTTGTAQALGPEGITPVAVASLRMAGGATLLLYALAGGARTPLRSMAGFPLVAAVVSMAVSQPLFFTGVARTGVGVGTIVTIGSGPILAGLLAWIVRGERVGRRWAVATAVSITGAGLLISGGQAAGIEPVGVAFALGSGFAWAVYLVSAKTLFDRHPPVLVAGVVFAGAAVVLAPWFVAADVSWLATGRGVLVAIWLGVVATALSYVLFATGLGLTRVAAAATLTLAEPLTAALLGVTVLGEPARPSTIGGAVLVGLGLLILSRERIHEAAVG